MSHIPSSAMISQDVCKSTRNDQKCHADLIVVLVVSFLHSEVEYGIKVYDSINIIV